MLTESGGHGGFVPSYLWPSHGGGVFLQRSYSSGEGVSATDDNAWWRVSVKMLASSSWRQRHFGIDTYNHTSPPDTKAVKCRSLRCAMDRSTILESVSSFPSALSAGALVGLGLV